MADEIVVEKQGRRASDWVIRFVGTLLESERSVLYWTFGWLLDEQHKPSFARMFLTFWTWVGWQMVKHELGLPKTGVALGAPVWTAWWMAEGVGFVAVFGPRVASYFGTFGSAAAEQVITTARDTIGKLSAVKEKVVGHESHASTDTAPKEPVT